jgi:hypothetical protein
VCHAHPLVEAMTVVSQESAAMGTRESRRHSRRAQVTTSAAASAAFAAVGAASAGAAGEQDSVAGLAVGLERLQSSLGRIHSEHTELRLLLEELRSRVADIECGAGRVATAFARMSELGAVVQGRSGVVNGGASGNFAGRRPNTAPPGQNIHFSNRPSNHSSGHSPIHTHPSSPRKPACNNSFGDGGRGGGRLLSGFRRH